MQKSVFLLAALLGLLAPAAVARTAEVGPMAQPAPLLASVEAFVFALVVAAVLTLIFSLGLNRPGPWTVWWTFFVLILLVAWASALWIVPVGPVFVGMYWLPVVMAALLIALLLASGSPQRPRVETHSEAEQQERVAKNVMNLLFVILVLLLIAFIVMGYLF